MRENSITLLHVTQEPTSGLDSAIAHDLMKSLTKLSTQQRKTIVATIHQPSSEIFNLFSKVLLLVAGEVRLLYCVVPRFLSILLDKILYLACVYEIRLGYCFRLSLIFRSSILDLAIKYRISLRILAYQLTLSSILQISSVSSRIL